MPGRSVASGLGRPEYVGVDDAVASICVADSGDAGATASVLDARSLRETLALPQYACPARLSPDGRSVACLYQLQRRLALIDVASSETVAEVSFEDATETACYFLTWSRGGRVVLAWGRGAMVLWAASGLRKLAARAIGSDSVHAALPLDDGRVVWVDCDGLHAGELERGEVQTRRGTYYHHRKGHCEIAQTHDGRSIAVTDGFRVWCFDLETLARRGVIQWKRRRRYRVLALGFSPDDARLFAATSIGPILAFDRLASAP